MMISIRAALIAASLAATTVAAPAIAQTVASGHRDILLQTDHSWNGVPYTHYPATQPELTMIRLTIPAHSALPWHKHPFPNAVYVLEGALTITDRESGKSHVYHAGEAFGESVDDVHHGQAGDTQTVLLITYAGTPGVPTSVPVKGQLPEY